ncbi:RmlC-like cupin domain-containing protein [Fusarium redolens]|uniref:RmlC-like cupin domain-containing protein n=1 Tax=Fusarium redolens TaxID=48865 RepID=A0A9P9KSK0_FUSRE|nr:RmlC-like cupin domain-containing protein [Fusarium redolens]KAH7267751.1 RmlC-like cupin domain-containing protein [Fusarium redolens]
MAGIKTTLVPPGKPDEAYLIPYLEGHVADIPSSSSVVRVMVTAKETNNTFGLVTSGGSEGSPIGFHYHKDAHDIFLCTKGQMNVWANDQGRTLDPGDMASAPPTPDTRDPTKTLFPRLMDLPGKHDFVPVPDHPAAEVTFCLPTDNIIPDGPEPYFLKADAGPNHQAITVVEGAFRVDVGEYAQEVQTGQTIFIPAGNAATLAATTRYASLYITCDGVGFPAALEAIGKEYSAPVISVGFDSDPDVSSYAKAFKCLGLQ